MIGINGDLVELAKRPYVEKSERAIWLQIYDRLDIAIVSELFPPGSKLPGENYLSDLFGVNRITMRRALSLHQQEGKLEARKGVGIFVRKKPRRFVIRDDMRFVDSLEAADGEISSETIFLGTGLPHPETKKIFNLRGRQKVIQLHRLRMVDGSPVYVSFKEFPLSLFPDFNAVYETTESVTAVYNSVGIHRYKRTETRVRGGLAGHNEARILKITPSTPVLYLTSINMTDEGHAIEVNRGCWPMSNIELVFSNKGDS